MSVSRPAARRDARDYDTAELLHALVYGRPGEPAERLARRRADPGWIVSGPHREPRPLAPRHPDRHWSAAAAIEAIEVQGAPLSPAAVKRLFVHERERAAMRGVGLVAVAHTEQRRARWSA